MTEYELKQHQFDREQSKKGEELADKLGRLVNVMGANKAQSAFCEAVRSEHRTLQQNIGGLLIELMKGWSEDCDSGRYDGRNESLVKFCNKLANHPDFKDSFDFGFPFI